jgi:hypothetical protein
LTTTSVASVLELHRPGGRVVEHGRIVARAHPAQPAGRRVDLQQQGDEAARVAHVQRELPVHVVDHLLDRPRLQRTAAQQRAFARHQQRSRMRRG